MVCSFCFYTEVHHGRADAWILTGPRHGVTRQVARKVVMLENDLERAEERAETGES